MKAGQETSTVNNINPYGIHRKPLSILMAILYGNFYFYMPGRIIFIIFALCVTYLEYVN
jgi:hypothetical protein